MAAITSIPKGSQISPATERIYHQSNLIGDWKGTWKGNSQPVEFKVVNIRGQAAQVEYTHNGHTERGIGEVDGATITFGDVTIGTKNGQVAALEFSAGVGKQTAVLNKQAAPGDQSKLVGTWTGVSQDKTQSALFQVVSVDGRDAQVKFTADGGAIQSGGGTVFKNTVMFGPTTQFTSNDGQTGNVVFKVGAKTFSVPVTKTQPKAAPAQQSIGFRFDKFA
jgi:hypothetical protein